MYHSSCADKQVFGKFQINVLDGTVDDPWNRSYLNSPQFTKTERTFPLDDFRAEVFGNSQSDAWSWSRSAELMKKYGFTAVKFDTSKYITTKEDEVQTRDFDDLNTLEEIYYPQVKESIVNLTGAKEVFITNSIVRTGEPGRRTKGSAKTNGSAPHMNAPADPNVPDTAAAIAQRQKDEMEHKALHDNRPTHLKSSDNAKPSRTPHMDYTPLGARRSIRSWRPDIYHAAVKSGVIPTEDDICTTAQVDAQTHDSDAIINTKYNANGKLGPRYAAYSVWRPLRTVTRDPLAMAPRHTFNDSKDLVFSPYHLKVLAAPSMKGDFLRELEALAMTEENATKAANGDDVAQLANGSVAASSPLGPRWYYLAQQKPDEVIILKFFDSAALNGGDSPGEEAPGVPHGSPDIGDAAYGPARESIEVRCICFW